ncbi:DUF3761 domain-containing protein [Candidatus Peregrinibacteria bacterium]|nr:DUF3761 domain-containing protein [Candidatus Peregrinibacteria bacterium]
MKEFLLVLQLFFSIAFAGNPGPTHLSSAQLVKENKPICETGVIENGKCVQYLSAKSPTTTNHYVNSAGKVIQSPTRYVSKPSGATAKCKDGTYSFSKSRRGTCSGHKGVSVWY